MIVEVDAVLFDSDGVLVDSHVAVERAWQRLATEFGLDIDELLPELSGVRAVDTLNKHLTASAVPVAVERLEQLELDLASDTAAVPGAVALTASLPTESWAIVTSGSKRLATSRWSAAEIPTPVVTVTAEMVTNGKPDPEPFLVAAELLGVDPTRCLVFEDSGSGAVAARAAGATVAAVGDALWPFEPAVRIADLTAVQAATRTGGAVQLRFAEDLSGEDLPGGRE